MSTPKADRLAKAQRLLEARLDAVLERATYEEPDASDGIYDRDVLGPLLVLLDGLDRLASLRRKTGRTKGTGHAR